MDDSADAAVDDSADAAEDDSTPEEPAAIGDASDVSLTQWIDEIFKI